MKPLNFGRLTRWILAWLLALPAVAAAADLALAASFAADAAAARNANIPILVFFSRADCPWCKIARRDYLQPLAQDPAAASRVLIREVVLRDARPLADFDGRSTTHADFAQARAVRMVPTLEFLDAKGRRLADPIVGVGADFYGAIIERAIDESLAKLRTDP
ncbi:MAG: thioredoxin family protein [Rhodocyclales bacterium]|nr:thioredoxin family protein [Rhodocyclales bacterium]